MDANQKLMAVKLANKAMGAKRPRNESSAHDRKKVFRKEYSSAVWNYVECSEDNKNAKCKLWPTELK